MGTSITCFDVKNLLLDYVGAPSWFHLIENDFTLTFYGRNFIIAEGYARFKLLDNENEFVFAELVVFRLVSDHRGKALSRDRSTDGRINPRTYSLKTVAHNLKLNK